MALLVGYICSMATTLTVLATLLYGFSGLADHPMQKSRPQPHLRSPIVQAAVTEKKTGLRNAATDVLASEGIDDARMQKEWRADAEKSKRMRPGYDKRKLLARQREEGGYHVALGYPHEPANDPRSWY
jgi:hypothetical protein